MKPFLTTLMLVPYLLYGQVYHTAFNRFDQGLNNGMGYSNYNNLNATLAWGESYIMMSYLTMYETTQDVFYLKRLVRHIDNVLQQRDDNAGKVDYRGISDATWISTTYTSGNPYAWLVHDGMLTYPIADFAQTVINNSALHSLVADTGGSFYASTDFITIAYDLLVQVDSTIDAHEDQWVNNAFGNNTGAYRFRWDALAQTFLGFPGDNLPLNQQNALGRTLVAMYEATGSAAYLDKATRLANTFKNDLVYQSATQSYVWSYWGYQGSTNEDISHAAINADFALQCYDAGIVFSLADMQRFAATFTNNIYVEPLLVNDWVDGAGGTNLYWAQSGRWVAFSRFDQEVYHIVSDLFLDAAINNTTVSGSWFPGIANLHRYRDHFSPFFVTRGYGSASDWAGVATGDFDGDGNEDIVTARNFDAHVYMWGFNRATNSLTGMGSLTTFGSASDWAGVTVGDFNGDGDDEFAIVRNFDGTLYSYDYVGGQIVTLAYNTNAGAGSQWADLAAGDVDGDGKDEIVAIRNSDGKAFVLKYSGGQLVTVASTGQLNNPAMQWAGIDCGDFNGNGFDEIVAVRNSNGNFYIARIENGKFRLKIVHSAPGPASQWTGVTAGDFDGDGIDEFLAHRDFDGDFWMYEVDLINRQIIGIGREHFPPDWQHACYAGFKRDSAGCEELIAFRNFDADIFMYDVAVGICGGGSQKRKLQDKKEIQEVSHSTQPGRHAVKAGNFIPNPASEVARLPISVSESQQLNFVITDMFGKIVFQNEMRITHHDPFIELNLEGLGKGCYSALLRFGCGEVVHRTILVL